MLRCWSYALSVSTLLEYRLSLADIHVAKELMKIWIG